MYCFFKEGLLTLQQGPVPGSTQNQTVSCAVFAKVFANVFPNHSHQKRYHQIREADPSFIT